MAVVAGASSSYPGVQNLLLAARALGRAANLTVWHFFAENELKQVLGVPKQVTVLRAYPYWRPVGPIRAGAAPSGRGRGALGPVVAMSRVAVVTGALPVLGGLWPVRWSRAPIRR